MGVRGRGVGGAGGGDRSAASASAFHCAADNYNVPSRKDLE